MTATQQSVVVMAALALLACGKSGDKGGGKKAKQSEAAHLVKKMYDGARAYYMDSGQTRTSITPVPAQFPAPSRGPTPPLGACCKTESKQCAPDASLWADPVWQALQFSVDEPSHYSYSYVTNDALSEFTVRANGDLDCDGDYSTFEMYGVINAEYGDGPTGSPAVYRVKELE